jgi:hypothetical protein
LELEIERENPERKELLELYKIAVEEYRFEVRLNWDRTRFFFGLTVAIVGAGAGLLRIGPSLLERGLVAGFFLVGAVVAAVGLGAIGKGHEYYGRSVDHLKTLEKQLQLEAPRRSLSTTLGMQDRTAAIIATEGKKRKGRWTITGGYKFLLSVALIADLGAASAIGFSIWRDRSSAAGGAAKSAPPSEAGRRTTPEPPPSPARSK